MQKAPLDELKNIKLNYFKQVSMEGLQILIENCKYLFFPFLSVISCKTVSGADCIFPFQYHGITYNACTRDHINDPTKPAWCATMVDESGGSTEWGYCEDKCQPSKLIFF